MAVLGHHLPLILCLLMGMVFSHFPEDNEEKVNGIINQHATLNCNFSIPEEWEQKVQVKWFNNFTNKILECMVEEGKAPACQRNASYSSRTRLSSGVLGGDASLEISKLRTLDSGSYQCWVIFSNMYKRQDSRLHVQGGWKESAADSSHVMGSQGAVKSVSSRDFTLLSGWLVALLLAMILIGHKFFVRDRKYKYIFHI